MKGSVNNFLVVSRYQKEMRLLIKHLLQVKTSKSFHSLLLSAKFYQIYLLKESLDWRKKSLVTPIKDEGQCGAFSATSALEDQQAIVSGKLVSLSRVKSY